MRRGPEDRRGGRGTLSPARIRLARGCLLAIGFALGLALAPWRAAAQDAPIRIDEGRFTVVCFPSEETLARSLVAYAIRSDTFPGLPRPQQRVLLALAPDRARFREWIGPAAPEWGSAIAFPESRRIVMQGRSAGSDAGDPRETFRHELAHLALHEFMGRLPPRWFDEGYAAYAAREWRRDDVLATSLGLAIRGMPTFDELDAQFSGPASGVATAYALAYRAVSDIAALDPERGLARLFPVWRSEGSLDGAMRKAYGMTLTGYEQRWRSATRRRYGALALVGDVTLGGILLVAMLFPFWLARRRRQRERLAAMKAADAAAEREAEVIDELLREVTSRQPPGPSEREG